MTVVSVPQLFIRSDYSHSHQGFIDSGFWSPMTWMTRSSSAIATGYYCSLIGKKFWTIGNSSDCTIVLKDPLISSQHALLLAIATREIYFCDLQSVNGSFVNGDMVIHPVLLRHGDRLKIGPFEMEFQNSSDLSTVKSLDLQKLVLLVQSSDVQGKIWKHLLRDCGISVFYEHLVDQNIHEVFETLIIGLDAFPDLLIVDVETLRPNPYEFCRWCRDNYPDLSIILTCSSRTDIFQSEQRWATQQGAITLLPGFIPDQLWNNLVDVAGRVDAVLHALGYQGIKLSSLEPMVRSLMQKVSPHRPPSSDQQSPSNLSSNHFPSNS